jgi:hypothetical protein
MAHRFAVDSIWFQRVTNYGAYDEATFAAIDVTSPQHPEHAQLLEVLRDPRLRSYGIHLNMNMLLALLPEVVASDERVEILYHATAAYPATI